MAGTRFCRALALAAALVAALQLAACPGPAAAAEDRGSWEAMTRLAERYSHVPATETEEVLLEEAGAKCVANVPNVMGVLPSSCCGEMRCPKSDGVCCHGNSHCCPAGHVCIQGDPGTPPGCLDVLTKKIPVAVHKILRKHHLNVKVVVPPKPKAAIPGYRPHGKLNYEDALAPRHRNVLAQHRIAETTHYHRTADGNPRQLKARDSYIMPNLPGFPTVPAAAIANAEVDPDTQTPEELAAKKAIAEGKTEWVAPGKVKATGGGVQNGDKSPLGLRTYGNDPVVMLPGKGRPTEMPAADLNKAQADLEEKGFHTTAVSVNNVKASTEFAKAKFREEYPRRSAAEEEEGAAALARLFPPDPESARHDPPRPPSEQEKTLARIAAQLAKVDRMRGQLRAELKDMQGSVTGVSIPGV